MLSIGLTRASAFAVIHGNFAAMSTRLAAAAETMGVEKIIDITRSVRPVLSPPSCHRGRRGLCHVTRAQYDSRR